MEGGEGGRRTSFSPIISTNILISPKTVLTFSYNPLATLVQKFKAIPFYETEDMTTSLIECLQLPNIGHMTKYTIKSNSCDK